MTIQLWNIMHLCLIVTYFVMVVRINFVHQGHIKPCIAVQSIWWQTSQDEPLILHGKNPICSLDWPQCCNNFKIKAICLVSDCAWCLIFLCACIFKTTGIQTPSVCLSTSTELIVSWESHFIKDLGLYIVFPATYRISHFWLCSFYHKHSLIVNQATMCLLLSLCYFITLIDL